MNIDRYGLSAQYEFSVSKNTFSDMERVVANLEAIISSVDKAEKALNGTDLASQISKIGSQTLTASKKVGQGNKQLESSLKQINKQLRPLKQEYRAVVNEARNIEWGDLLQPRKFARAKREANRYIDELKVLETQVEGNTAVERAFVAQLKRKQVTMKNNIELQKQERLAAKAAYRIGEAKVFRQIGASVIVPFQRIAGDGIKTLAEFDDKMSSVKAVSGATASEMRQLRNEAKKLGASTKFSASQVAEAQGYLAMAGLQATEVLVAQKHALTLAAAGNLELGEAADIASNAMSAFGLEADQMERIANVMARTASTTNTNVSQLGEAFKMAAPNAKQFGATLEETAALMGIAGNVGIQGSLAGTGARSGFINLTQSTKQKALERNFGVSAINEDGTAKNIISIVGELKDSLDVDFRDPQFIRDLQGIEDDLANGVEGAEGSLKDLTTKYPQYAKGLAGLTDVFGKTAVSFWSAQISQYDQLQKQALLEFASGVDEKALARQLGIDPSVDLFKEVIAQSENYEAAVATLQGGIRGLIRTGRGGEGAASAMARIMEQNLAGSFRSLGSAIEAFKIAYFEPLKPAIMAIVNTLARLLRFMANLPAPVRTIISGFGVMAVSAAALTVVVATLATTLFTFSKAAGIAAIAQNNLAAGAAIPLTGFFQTSMEGMAATSPIDTISRNYGLFLDDFSSAWRKTLGDSLKGLRLWAAKATMLIRDVTMVARSLLFNPFTMWIAGILIINALIEQVVPGFNLLGTVVGALVAPFAFLYGFAKGLLGAFLDVANLGKSQTLGAIAPIFQSIGNAVAVAIRSFELFSDSGERLGKAFGNFLTAPFRGASSAIINLWNTTIAAIRRPLQPFADFVKWVGKQLVKFLAENSPGPTFLIRKRWGMTIDYLRGLLGGLVKFIVGVSNKIVNFLNSLPLETFQKVLTIFSLLAAINPATTGITAIANIAVLLSQVLVSSVLLQKHLVEGKGFKALNDLFLSIFARGIILRNIVLQVLAGLEEFTPAVAALQYGIFGLVNILISVASFAYQITWVSENIDRLYQGVLFLTENFKKLLRPLAEGFRLIKSFSYSFVLLIKAANRGVDLDKLGALSAIFEASVRQVEFLSLSIAYLHSLFPKFGSDNSVWARGIANALLSIDRALVLTVIKWRDTFSSIKSLVGNFISWLQGIGSHIVAALAENSPGPSFQVRQKWTMTIDYLTLLFKRIIRVANLVNSAFLGIGDVTEKVRNKARADLFSGFLAGVMAASRGIAHFISLIISLPGIINSAVDRALDNLDLFSFFALVGSSLPMTLMSQLRVTAAAIVPELALILSTGIPRAILYALPAAVAYAISSGAIQGAEAGIGRFLDRLPEMFGRVTQKIRSSVAPEMKAEINEAINSSLSTIASAINFQGAIDFDLDTSLTKIDRFAESALRDIVDYLQQIGEVSRTVGQGIARILEPILNLKMLPFLPSTIVNLTVLIPLYKALGEIIGSPTLQGSIGFLANTLFPALLRSIQATAATLSYFVTMLLSAPTLFLAETMEQIFGVLSRTKKVVDAFSISAIVRSIVSTIVSSFQNLIYRTIPGLLARIPGIGEAIAKTFVSVMQILSRFIPRYFKLMLDFFPTEVFASLFASYKNVFVGIGRGIAYAIEEGLAPVAGIFLRLLNPVSALNFIKLYFKTSGFRTIVKSGLFAVNPLDLLFGSKWMELAIAGMKVFAQMAFPKNIVSSKMSEALQMLADPMARSRAIRHSRDSGMGLLVSRLEIYKKSSPAVRILIRLLESLMIINPIVQLVGSLAMSMLFWYSVLKPLNNEMILAIGHIEVFNISLMPLAIALKGIRFLVVDVGEVLGNMLLGTPAAIKMTMAWFDKLGDAIGKIVGVSAEVSRIILNISKDLIFDPLFAAIAYPIAMGLRLVLVEARKLLWFIKNETEAYGDAIVALTHGNIMPLMRQLFYDLMLRPLHLIENLLDLTIGNVLRGLAAISRGIFAVGKEIVMLITHPVDESKRLVGLLGTEFDKLQEKIAPFTDRLSAVTSFLATHKALIAALAVGIARVLGVFTGYTLIVDIMSAIAFLIVEYKNGFQVLNGLISALGHPIAFLDGAIRSIGDALHFSLPPEFSDVLALVTNSLISAFPIIIAGIFTVGLLLRKNIGDSFGFVLDSGMKFVGVIISAIDAMRDLAYMTQKTLNRTPLPMAAAQGLHNIRSTDSIAGFGNPLAYSRDRGMQQQAVDMGNNLKIAKELRRYEKAYLKNLKRMEKETTRKMIRQAKYGTPAEKLKIFANQNIDANGRVTSRQPMLEEYKNKFGKKDYRATEYGRMQIREEVSSSSASGKATLDLFKAYRKHGSAGLDYEKLKGINKDIYDRYRGKQTTPHTQQLIQEVRSGMESLHDTKNLKSIQSKFIYADAIQIKGGINDLNSHNFDERIGGLRKNQALPESFRGAMDNVVSVETFKRELNNLRGDDAGAKLDSLFDKYNEINRKNVVGAGGSYEDSYNLKSTLYKKNNFDSAMGSNDITAINRIKQELIRDYVNQQEQAIVAIAKAQKVDIKNVSAFGGANARVLTQPLDILRQGMSNLVDESISQSRNAERGILGSAKRLKNGFLQFTGLQEWFASIRQNFAKDKYVRILEKSAAIRQFTSDKKNKLMEVKRRRSLYNQLEKNGFESIGEAVDDPRQKNILENFLKTGKARYTPKMEHYENMLGRMGGSFVTTDPEGRTQNKTFAEGKRVFTESLNTKNLQDFRKYIEYGHEQDKGIGEKRLKEIIAAMSNKGVKFDGAKGATAIKQILNEFRMTMDETQRKDFQAMLGSPRNSVRATEDELRSISGSLSLPNFGSLAKGIGSDNKVKDFAHGIQDFFTDVNNKLDTVDLQIKEGVKDLEAYANVSPIGKKLYGIVNTSIMPLYQTAFNSVKNGINKIYTNAESAVYAAQDKINSLATVQSFKNIAKQIRMSNNSILTASRNYGGRKIKSIQNLAGFLMHELQKAGIDQIGDRQKIAAAFLKSRETGESIEDLLKKSGYKNKLGQINEAFAKTVGIKLNDAVKIVADPNVSSKIGAPMQILVMQNLPAIAMAAGKDFARVYNATIGKVLKAAGREILVNLSPEISKDLGKWSKKLHDFVGKGLSDSANVIADLTGDNRLVKSLRRWSESLFDRGMASADKLFAISTSAGNGETTKLRKVFDAAKGIYDSIAERLKGVKTKIDAQGGLWAVVKKTWASLKQMFTGKGEKTTGERVHQGRQDVARLRQERDMAWSLQHYGGVDGLSGGGASGRVLDANARINSQRNLEIAEARLAEDEGKLARKGSWLRKMARNLRLQQAEFRHSDTTSNVRQQGMQGTGARNTRAYGTSEQAQNLKGYVARMASYSEQRLPKFKEMLANMADAASKTSQEIAVNFSGSARKSGDHWEYARNKIAGTWTNLWAKAKEAGQKILHNISENSPGPSAQARANWERTRNSVEDNMFDMASTSSKAGRLIEQGMKASSSHVSNSWSNTRNKVSGSLKGMVDYAKNKVHYWLGRHASEGSEGPSSNTRASWQHTEQAVSQNLEQMVDAAAQTHQGIDREMNATTEHTQTRFSKMSKAVGGFWKTGLMVGSSLSALGMASQTIGYSLSNMGIIEQDSDLMKALTNIGEITTIVGSLGTVAAPMISLGISLTGSLVAGMGAIVPLVTEIGTAIATFGGLSTVGLTPIILGIGAIVVGLTGLYYAFRTNFLGITTIARGFGKTLSTIFALPIAWVTDAWQAFADKFGGILYPIIEPAINVAHGLIAALNCHPTVRVTQAWHGAVDNIQGFLGGLLAFGIGIGQKLADIFSGITGLFKNKEVSQSDRASGEPVKSSRDQKRGGILGLTAVVAAPLKILFMTVYNAVDSVAGKLANFIKPLVDKVKVIAEFFESLATIVESIAYIEKVIGPLIGKNKIIFKSITALANTLNNIAIIFDSIDYITTFLFRHKQLKERTAYTQHATREGSLPEEESATPSKPVSGISQLISFGKVFGGMVGSILSIKSNWKETTDFIHTSTSGLESKTAITGHELKANLSEASPGPTYWIRKNWAKTTDSVDGNVGDLAKSAIDNGSDIAKYWDNFVASPAPGASLMSGQSPTENLDKFFDSAARTKNNLSLPQLGMNGLKGVGSTYQNTDPEAIKQALLMSEITGIGKRPAKIAAFGAIESGKISAAEYQDIQERAAVLKSPTQRLADEAFKLRIATYKLSMTMSLLTSGTKLIDTVKSVTGGSAAVAAVTPDAKATVKRGKTLSQRMGSVSPSKARTIAPPRSLLEVVKSGFMGVGNSLTKIISSIGIAIASLRTMAISQLASISGFVATNPIAAIGLAIGAATLLLELITPHIEIIGHILGVVVSPISLLYGALGQVADRLGILDFEKFNRQLIAFTRNIVISLNPATFIKRTSAVVGAYFITVQNVARVAVDKIFDHIFGEGKKLPEVLASLWNGFLDRTFDARYAISDFAGDIKNKLVGAWTGFTSVISNSWSGIKDGLSQLNNIFDGIKEKWDNTVGFIGSKLGLFKDSTAETGHELKANLSEASPGPTYWIRKNWAKTTEFVGKKVGAMATDAEAMGERMKYGLMFGDVVELSLYGASSGIKSLTWNTIAFGIASVASLSPVLGAFGVFALTTAIISFGVAVMVSNFLGLRTILKGMARVVKGLGIAVWETVRGVTISLDGLRIVAVGVFKLIHGDVTTLWRGVDRLKEGFAVATQGITAGLFEIRFGLSLIIDGLLTGIAQVFGVEVHHVKRYLQDLWLILSNGALTGDLVAEKLIAAFKSMGRIWSILLNKAVVGARNIRDRVGEIISGLFSPRDKSSNRLVDNLKWVFSKQGLAALGFNNPAQGIVESFRTAFNLLPNAVAAPLKYIGDFFSAFGARIMRELPPSLQSALAIDNIRLKIEQITNFATDRFGQLIAWLRTIEWLPKNLEELRIGLVQAIDFAQDKFKIFIGWLTTTRIVPKGFLFLSGMLKSISQLFSNLEGRIAMIRLKLAMKGTQSNFATKMLTGIQLLLGGLRSLSLFGSKAFKLITKGWLKIRGAIGETGVFDFAFNTIRQGVRSLPIALETIKRSLTGATDWIFVTIVNLEHLWHQFTAWIGNDIAWSEKITAVWQQIKDSSSKAVEWIKGAWVGFRERFEVILAPIAEFAHKIALKLISALNCNPTERIPNAWEQGMNRVTGAIRGILKPATWTAKKIISSFKPTAAFLWSIGGGFVTEVVPAMNIVGEAFGKGKRSMNEFIDEVRRGLSTTGDGRKEVKGLVGAMVRLLDAISPLRNAFSNLVGNSEQIRLSFGDANTSGEKFGSMLGKIVGSLLKFGAAVAPGLGKTVGFIARITVEIATFAAKVAWAMRYVINAGLAVGVAAGEAAMSIAKFIQSIWRGMIRVTNAASEFKNTVINSVSAIISAIWDIAVAIDKVIMSVLKSKFPKIYGAIAQIRVLTKRLGKSFQFVRRLIGKEMQPKESSLTFWESLTGAIGGTIFALTKVAKIIRLIVFPKEIIAGIAIGIEKMSNFVRNNFQKLYADLDEMFDLTTKINYLRVMLTDLPRAVKTAYVEAFISIKATVTTVFEAIKEQLLTLRAKFYEVVERFLPALVPILQKIEKEVVYLFEMVIISVRDLISKIEAFFSPIVGGIFRTIGRVGDRIKSIILDIFNSITGFKDYFKSFTVEMKGLVTNAFGTLGSEVKQVVIDSKYDLKEFITWIDTSIKGLWAGFKNSIAQMFAPIPEAEAAIRSLFVAIEKIGGAIVDLTAGFFKFGGQIISSIADIASKFGGLIKGLLRLKMKLLLPLGPLGMLGAVVNTTKAIIELIGNMKNILTEGIPIFNKIESLFSAPAKAVTEKWGAATDRIKGMWRGLKPVADDAGRDAETGLSENSPGPSFMVRQKWAKTVEFVADKMQSLSQVASSVGREIAQANEKSVNKTLSAYKKLDNYKPKNKAARDLFSQYKDYGDLNSFSTGRKLRNLDIGEQKVKSDKSLTREEKQLRLARIGATRKSAIERGKGELSQLKQLADLKNANAKAGRAMQSATMSAGAALSNFAPQLATPLFVAGDMVDAYRDLSTAIPDVIGALATKGAAVTATAATETAANGAVAASHAGVAGTTVATTTVEVGAAVTATTAEVTRANVTVGAHAMIMASLSAVGGAALWTSKMLVKAAVASVKFLVVNWYILAIAAAVTGLYLAFKYNFLNINDIIDALISAVKTIASPFITVGKAIFDFYSILIGGVLGEVGKIIQIIGGTIGSVLHSIAIALGNLFLPIAQLFNLFFGSGGGLGIGNILTTIAKTIVGMVSLITKAVALVGNTISWVFGLLQPIGMWLGETVMSYVGLLTIFGSIALVVTNFAGAVALVGSGLGALAAPIIALVTFVAPALSIVWGTVQLIAFLALPAIGSAIVGMATALAPIMLTIIAIAGIGIILKPIFSLVMAAIAGILQGIKLVFSEVFGELAIAGKEIWQTFKVLGSVLIEPFKPLMELFGAGGGDGLMVKGMRLMVKGILLPFKVLAFVLTTIIKTVSVVIQSVVLLGAAITRAVLTPVRLVISAVSTIKNIFSSFALVVSSIGELIINAIATPFRAITGALSWVLGKLGLGGEKQTSSTYDTQVQKFASGGPVRGAGTGTSDSIRAMLSDGEFVVNAASTKGNLGLLNTLNATGQIPEREFGLRRALELFPEFPRLEILKPALPSLPSPETIDLVASKTTSADLENAKIEVNFTGDIIIKSESTPEMVREMMDQLGPEFALKIKSILRDEVRRIR